MESPSNRPKTNDHGVEVVCCGCRAAPKRRFRKIGASFRNHILGTQKFEDAEQATSQEMNNLDEEEDSLFFFDACQNELADDEYPIIFTNTLSHPAPDVSMERPESLIRKVEFVEETAKGENEQTKIDRRKHLSEPIKNLKSRSLRFQELVSRSLEEQNEILEQPPVKIPLNGYPGGLTLSELNECQKFLAGLKTMDVGVSEQVYSLRDVESEPYTICRWLRATKFDADAILTRLEENQPQFEAARDNHFFPNPSEALGAPFSVFLSQFPLLAIGQAKNLCPVNYMQAGKINPEGIGALSTPSKLEGYFWWSFMYKFKQEVRKAKAVDPDFVRLEGINIIDLDGLSSAALSSETIDVVKLSSKISDFFPETLHCMLIINAPGFFSLFWGLIKKFIDPRTAQRIQVFSNTEKGLAALRKMVDVSQIPSDYGGTNKSVAQAFIEESADPLLRKQHIELVHVKKNKDAVMNEITLAKDEHMEIRVYTRSMSPGNVQVEVDGKIHARVHATSKWDAEELKPAPQCNLIAKGINGPATVKISVVDIKFVEKKQSKHSRGYFLVVADVKGSSATPTQKQQ